MVNMGKRFAAHYIWLGDRVHAMRFLEVDASGFLCGLYPLTEEIARTIFFNGVLVPLPASLEKEADFWIRQWRQIPPVLFEKEPLGLYQLETIDLAAAKLGTDNSGRYRYVKRF